MDTSFSDRTQKKQRVACSKQFKMFGPDGSNERAISSLEMKFRFPFKTFQTLILDVGGHWWWKTCGAWAKISVLKEDFSSPFFLFHGFVDVDILPEKATLTCRYYVKTVSLQVIQAIHDQRPHAGRWKTLILHAQLECPQGQGHNHPCRRTICPSSSPTT